ncbi:hypothetical protein Hanom_Chr12g01067801 [Helianthus anomalus]
MEWATSDNFNDCGVFNMRNMEMYKWSAMRNMEMYKWSEVKFECGFSTRKDIQDMQLKNLMMKIATKLLLSEANVYKETVMELAKETTCGVRDEKMRKMS